MASHYEIAGEGVVGMAVQVVVEERCLRLSWVHIVLEFHAGVVQADIMEPAQPHDQCHGNIAMPDEHNASTYLPVWSVN